MSGLRRSTGSDGLLEVAGQHRGEQRALIALGVVGVALALVLAAFFVGRGVGGDLDTAASSPPPNGSEADSLAAAALGEVPAPSATASPTRSPTGSSGEARSPRPRGRLSGRAWRGAVTRLPVGNAAAGCRAEGSIDAGGHRVGYPADHVLDDDPTTAWRCEGDGRGVTLTLRLPATRTIAQVGIVPGYAKTDPFNGADRYAQNRRISRVRWTFDGGRWAEQRLRTAADDRGLQTMRIPPVRSRRVRLTIEDSTAAPRNTVAISTVRLARPDR